MTPEDLDFTDAAFQAQLDALRRHYVEGLQARRSALNDAWCRCSDGGEEAAWRTLRDVAHKLSGSASSYGLDALGGAARDLDKLLSGRTPCRRRAGVEAEVARLTTLLDAAIPRG